MDLKRVAPREPDRTSDPVILERIREEIRRDGPITFARFMEIALYDPERGYYRSDAARAGRAGDFLTAPEAHPIFGRALARFAASVSEALGSPPTLTIRELGAGTGALAAPLVAALLDRAEAGSHRAPPMAIRYLVDEIEPRRVDAVRRRLAELDIPAGARVDTGPDDGRAIDGLVIANEVLDALPTHRVVQRGAALREIFVGLDGDAQLTDVEDEPSTGQLAARLTAEAIALRDGQRGEICLAVDPWIARAAQGLRNGVLLLLDYGHPAADLYDPRRLSAGTLATYQEHVVGDDPYRSVGRQDLTAHVDLTAVDAAATGAGLTRIGSTTQSAFLAGLGLGELLVAEQTRGGATLQGYLEARSAVVRMIDPAAMGSFRVMAYATGSLVGARLPGLDSAG